MLLPLRKLSVGNNSLSSCRQSPSLLMSQSRKSRRLYAVGPSFSRPKIMTHLLTVSLSLPHPHSEMFIAWWSEFEDRDGDAVSRQVKLHSLFRGSISRHVSRMYESPNNLLSLDAPLRPLRATRGSRLHRKKWRLTNVTFVFWS